MQKNILYITSLVSTISFASCQEKANVKMTFHLHDESGNPVENATIRAHTFDHWEPGEAFGKDVSVTTEGKSDALGDCVMTTDSLRGEFVFQFSKEGFYAIRLMDYKFPNKVNGSWQPWNPRIDIELRKIANPIPLIAKKVADEISNPIKIPVVGAPVGYDLEIGDWIVPYGRGKTSDLVFQLEGKKSNLNEDYQSKLKISFSNPKDGLILHLAEPYKGSELKLPHLAPVDGYAPELIKHKSRLVNKDTQTPGPMGKYEDDTSRSENYFLRLRTTTNAQGEITSACYAKVYGPFEWFVSGKIRFQYYFNPTPNDRNLEFDPKRNLLILPDGQKIKEP